MADTNLYDITGIVGNEGTEADAVKRLITLVTRTFSPDQWFAMGGLWTIQAVYNPVTRKWWLSVFSDISPNDFQARLDKMKTP